MSPDVDLAWSLPTTREDARRFQRVRVSLWARARAWILGVRP